MALTMCSKFCFVKFSERWSESGGSGGLFSTQFDYLKKNKAKDSDNVRFGTGLLCNATYKAT